MPGRSLDVLIVPQRVVPRLSDLSSGEIADVFQSVQTVSRVIEQEFGGESVTVACQVRLRFCRLDVNVRRTIA